MSLLQDPSQVAVQLLDSDDGNLVPIQEGMDLLRSMGRIDAAVVVIGPMRSGKSVLCNVLFGRDGTFEISNKQDSCTKGVWICPEPVIWDEKRVILLDVEGTGDCDADPASEMALLMIARLVSSVLVFNTNSGPPNRHLLGLLETLAQTCERMAEKSRTHLPKASFFWMFRNLDFESEDFQEEFTRKIFSSSRGQNPVALGLQEHFGDIQAIQMRSPMTQHNLGLANLSECGENFRRDLAVACERLKRAAMEAQPMVLSTGNALAEYVLKVVETLNTSGPNDILHVHDLLQSLQVNELVQEAQEQFDPQITFPTTEDNIHATVSSISTFLQETHPNISHSVWAAVNARILDTTNPASVLARALAENAQAAHLHMIHLQTEIETALSKIEEAKDLPDRASFVRFWTEGFCGPPDLAGLWAKTVALEFDYRQAQLTCKDAHQIAQEAQTDAKSNSDRLQQLEAKVKAKLEIAKQREQFLLDRIRNDELNLKKEMQEIKRQNTALMKKSQTPSLLEVVTPVLGIVEHVLKQQGAVEGIKTLASAAKNVGAMMKKKEEGGEGQ